MASQASASESRVLAKKNTKKENSPATDSRTQTSFQTFHTVFPVIFYSLQNKKSPKSPPHFTVTQHPHRPINTVLRIPNLQSKPTFRSRCCDLQSANLTFFFFLSTTHAHSYRLSAIFSLRINFTTLSFLSLLKRSIERRIRVLSAIDSLQFRLRCFFSL